MSSESHNMVEETHCRALGSKAQINLSDRSQASTASATSSLAADFDVFTFP